MEAIRFVSLFEDFGTQSGRIFIDDLETAFEIEGIVEDKWKKFLFKMKLSGLCRQWYDSEFDYYDYEEYKILKWVDIKEMFLSRSNIFYNGNHRVKSYKGIKDCFIEENSQANECEVNQRSDQCCIIENKEVNESEVVEESNECFIENSKKSDMNVENFEDNQMIDEDNLFSSDDKGLQSIKKNEANNTCCVMHEVKIQTVEYKSEARVKPTPNENNGFMIMSFGYEFNKERHKFIHILKMKGTKWKLFYFYLISILNTNRKLSKLNFLS